MSSQTKLFIMSAFSKDKINVLGGTIGLFTGMSILSVFEVIFWIGKAVMAIVGKAD